MRKWKIEQKANVEKRHTPTPWGSSIGAYGASFYPNNQASHPLSFEFYWDKARGNPELTNEAIANAAFIVKAVNNHEALVEACRLALELPASRESKRALEQALSKLEGEGRSS